MLLSVIDTARVHSKGARDLFRAGLDDDDMVICLVFFIFI